MDLNEYMKLSPDETKEWTFTTLGKMDQKINDMSESIKRMENMMLADREKRADVETRVEELTANMNANSDVITALTNRLDDLESKVTEKEPTVKAENVTVTNEYMPGVTNVLEYIDSRNRAKNEAEGRANVGDEQDETKSGVVNGGMRSISGGSLQQEDKVIKLWEVARVNAKNTMFDMAWMWWPDINEVKAEEFNSINFFEESLGVQQVKWCKNLIYIPDRSSYMQLGDENISRNSETCAKLDDQFRKHAPEFLADENVIYFDEYLERFWMAARRYHMTNHQLCKEILYEKCTGVRAACGYTLKPTDMENRQLTFKGFLCKMRDLFLPPDMKNVCKDAYLSVKQHENDKIDAFFDKILSFWKRAYPGPTDDSYMDFYSQVCNVILSPTLANQMRQFAVELERDGQVRNMTKFRTELLQRAQLIVKGLKHNQISGSMARGCSTNQMVLARTMIGGAGSKENPINIDQVSDDDFGSSDIYQLEIDLADEFDYVLTL